MGTFVIKPRGNHLALWEVRERRIRLSITVAMGDLVEAIRTPKRYLRGHSFTKGKVEYISILFIFSD